MEEPKKKKVEEEEAVGLNGKLMERQLMEKISHVSSSPAFWKSRKRAARAKNSEMLIEDHSGQKEEEATPEAMQEDSSTTPVVLSEKRKALFEPLEPMPSMSGRRNSAELLLPPPDFDSALYPKGWLIGKKRKLVNVDVVESMRRIAVQEMNRKDREIGGLNEQLEEDARCLEHLQIQLLEERSKRSDVERQNAMLQNQINMLMDMLQENENLDDDDGGAEEP